MADRERIGQIISRGLASSAPDWALFVADGAGSQPGLVRVRRPHWPAGKVIEIPASGVDTEAGGQIDIRFHQRNRQLPYASRRGPSAEGIIQAAQTIQIGFWDQTWRSYYQDARSNQSSAPATLDSETCWTFDSDADGGGLYWEPEGLLVHKTGRVWHLSRWTDLAEAFEVAELRVRLLVPSGTYAVSASAALELVGHERETANWLLPDATCFYDPTDDVLVVLIKPTRQKIDDEQARVWTLRPNEAIDGFVSAVSSFDLGPEGARRGWANVGVAGRRMIRLDFPGATFDRFALSTETLEWSGVGGAGISGTFGTTYTGPGWRADSFDASPQRNYSPAYTQGKWRTAIATRVDDSGDWVDYRLNELSIAAEDGEQTEIELAARDNVVRAQPVQLAICGEWAESHLEAIDSNTNIPADGNYDEVGFVDQSRAVTNGYPPEHELYESTMVEWTEWTSRRWLGCAFAAFEHEWDSGGDLNNYPNLRTPDYPDTCGGVPLPPATLPAVSPNRAWWGRAFWAGQPSGRRDWRGLIPQSDDCSIALPDGWRYRLALVPDEPVWVPASTYGDLWHNNSHDSYEQRFRQSKLLPFSNVHPSIPFPESFLDNYEWAERRQISWVEPQMRWTFKTVLFSIAPNGTVYEKTLSAKWPGLEYPGRLGTGAPVLHTISEELSIPVNAYQLFTVPRHNLLGVIVDHLETALGDPAPAVLLLDRSNPADLPEVYRIPATSIYPEACLELCTEDSTFAGGEGDSIDPDYWQRVGQYKYLLHGADEAGPLCKLIDRASETLLVMGWQAVQRVAPVTGTPGQTYNGLSLFRLGAASADHLGSDNNTGSWTWGASRAGNDNTHGPRVLRSMAVLSDRAAWGSLIGEVGKPGLKQIV